MIRTQIYLTESERRALRRLARRTGYTQSKLIREAVDRFITQSQAEVDRRSLLRQARGLWQNRDDLAEPAALRRELDRHVTDVGC